MRFGRIKLGVVLSVVAVAAVLLAPTLAVGAEADDNLPVAETTSSEVTSTVSAASDQHDVYRIAVPASHRLVLSLETTGVARVRILSAAATDVADATAVLSDSRSFVGGTHWLYAPFGPGTPGYCYIDVSAPTKATGYRLTWSIDGVPVTGFTNVTAGAVRVPVDSAIKPAFTAFDALSGRPLDTISAGLQRSYDLNSWSMVGEMPFSAAAYRFTPLTVSRNMWIRPVRLTEVSRYAVQSPGTPVRYEVTPKMGVSGYTVNGLADKTYPFKATISPRRPVGTKAVVLYVSYASGKEVVLGRGAVVSNSGNTSTVKGTYRLPSKGSWAVRCRVLGDSYSVEGNQKVQDFTANLPILTKSTYTKTLSFRSPSGFHSESYKAARLTLKSRAGVPMAGKRVRVSGKSLHAPFVTTQNYVTNKYGQVDTHVVGAGSASFAGDSNNMSAGLVF